MVSVMGIEAVGKLHAVYETKQVSERFSKREFVVEITDNPKYPQTVLFQLTGDRCSQLDGLNVGDHVAIEFSLRGREWKAPSGEVKYFNSLDVWKVVPARAGASNGGPRGGRNTQNGYGGGYANGSYGGGTGDPRADIVVPRDYEARSGEEPANDDIPF
jgi:hypothetical protein